MKLNIEFLRFVLSGILLLSIAFPAFSENRVALVIGNSDYEKVPRLANPINDAKLVSGSLKEVGFQVFEAINASRREMVSAIRSFTESLNNDTEAFIYFAGHGIQFETGNYLLPVDIEVKEVSQLPLEAIELHAINSQIESRKPRIAIIVLDACRNNPIKGGTRSGGPEGGLARATGPLGTYIAFATAPGEVALDGKGKNSPFSRALADFITKPGLPIEQVFKRVRERVVDETDGVQVPWDNSSLIGDFFFQRLLLEVPDAAEKAQKDANAWKLASEENSLSAYRQYLEAHEDGMFADLAKANLNQISDVNSGQQATNTSKASSRLTQVNRNVGMSSDVLAWNTANASGLPEAYKKYLAVHPNGLFSKLARLRLEDSSKSSVGSIGDIASKLTPNFEEFEESPLYPEVTLCDRLAGHVQEAADPAVGVFFREIDVESAIPACLEALNQYPDSLRLLINYARAIDAAGRHDEAREIYKAGVEAGFPIAMRSLGDVYRDGRGVAENLDEARYWYVLGAEKNNVFAQLNLAVIYENGMGVPVDKSKAVYWLWRAGRQGFATAMEKLAGYYLRGEIVKRDAKQAAILLQSAADMGNMWAEHNLSELYLNGIGVEKNVNLGKKLSERAAVQGNKWAQAKLASLFNEGIGTEKNSKAALQWAYLAQNSGVEWVVEMVKDLETRVTESQKRAARKFVESFQPRKVK